MTTPSRSALDAIARRLYECPKLVHFGDLAEVTMSGSGGTGDGLAGSGGGGPTIDPNQRPPGGPPGPPVPGSPTGNSSTF